MIKQIYVQYTGKVTSDPQAVTCEVTEVTDTGVWIRIYPKESPVRWVSLHISDLDLCQWMELIEKKRLEISGSELPEIPLPDDGDYPL